MYLLIPVFFLYLLPLFLIFFTVLVVILHNLPYRHETEMTNCNEDRYHKSFEPRGRDAEVDPVVGVSAWHRQPWRHKGRFERSESYCTMTAALWTLLMALPSLVCALYDTQIPFHKPADNIMVAHGTKPTFRFKEGSDVFTPKDLIELSRPGSGVANVPGDLILVPVSKYSFEDKKYVRVSLPLACFEAPIRSGCLPLTRACSGVRVGLPMPFRDVRVQQPMWDTGHEEGMCRKHVFSFLFFSIPPEV